MNDLATRRQQQRSRASDALGWLVVVWLNLTPQVCAATVPASESAGDGAGASNALDVKGTHSGHANAEECPFCLDCDHERCVELALCERPVVAGAGAGILAVDTIDRLVHLPNGRTRRNLCISSEGEHHVTYQDR